MNQQRSLIDTAPRAAIDVMPDSVVNGGIAIIGKTGAGKTFTAKGLVERVLDAGYRTCIIDPTGVWWGLRASADGTQSGFPVVVFGGMHADVPISDRSGAILAKLIAEQNLPAIVDVSEMTIAGRTRFMSAFLESLYHNNRKPLTLVVDEADMFAPQSPMPDQTVMLSRMEQIARRGRVRGFRLWQITQRPAVLHKSILSQADTLIAMKLVSPQDRKALGEWIKGQADIDEGKAVLADLPRLQRGCGWIWSPEFGVLERAIFPAITTFDSSRTPEHDDEVSEPMRLADVDVSGLVASMRAAEAEAEANDPKVLLARIAELEALIEEPAGEVPVVDESAVAREKEEAHCRGALDAMTFGRDRLDSIMDDMDKLRMDFSSRIGMLSSRLAPHGAADVVQVVQVVQAQRKTAGGAGTAAPSTPRGVSAMGKRILDALAWWSAAGVTQPTREQAGFVAQAKPNGGHFANTISSLRTGGFIDYPQAGLLSLTPAGMRSAAPVVQSPTRTELIERARSVIRDSAQVRVFDVVCRHRSITRERLAEQAEFKPGGHFANTVSALKTAGLLEYPEKGLVALSNAFRGLPS